MTDIHNASELSFGLCWKEITGKALWGARAIFSRGTIDIVWDRKSSVGDEADLKRLYKALDGGAFDRLRETVKNATLYPDSEGVLVIEDGDLTIVCSTNASFGYLYITVALDGALDPATKSDLSEKDRFIGTIKVAA